LVFAQTYQPEAIRQANLGVNLSKKQDYPAATAAYKRALAADATLPNLYLNLGLAYFKQGRFQDALAAFQHEQPTAQVTTLIGMSHFGLAEYNQAALALQPLSTAQPDNAELSYLLAKCYLWDGQHDKAMDLFRKLLDRDPESASAHMLLGEALDADDRETEAISEFETAAKAAPALPEAHFGLGYLYWKQRRYSDAERQFELELKGNSENALALAYLGDILLRDGRNVRALKLLNQANALNPNLHVVHQDLGTYYQDAKQFTSAVKEFRESVRTAPDNYDAHYRLARTYRQMGLTAEANKEFAIVQKLHAGKDEEPLMRISGPH